MILQKRGEKRRGFRYFDARAVCQYAQSGPVSWGARKIEQRRGERFRYFGGQMEERNASAFLFKFSYQVRFFFFQQKSLFSLFFKGYCYLRHRSRNFLFDTASQISGIFCDAAPCSRHILLPQIGSAPPERCWHGARPSLKLSHGRNGPGIEEISGILVHPKHAHICVTNRGLRYLRHAGRKCRICYTATRGHS